MLAGAVLANVRKVQLTVPSLRAAMTLPRAERDLLIFLASSSTAPSAPVLLTWKKGSSSSSSSSSCLEDRCDEIMWRSQWRAKWWNNNQVNYLFKTMNHCVMIFPSPVQSQIMPSLIMRDLLLFDLEIFWSYIYIYNIYLEFWKEQCYLDLTEKCNCYSSTLWSRQKKKTSSNFMSQITEWMTFSLPARSTR